MNTQITERGMLKIGEILCPVDFSEFSAKAYEHASSLARHYRAELFLEHVVEPPPCVHAEYPSPGLLYEIQQDLEAGARRQLDELVKTHIRNGIQPTLEVREGHRVIQLASCPVLAVRI